VCPESEPASHHSPSDRDGTRSEPIELTALSLEVSILSTSVRDMDAVVPAAPFMLKLLIALLLSNIRIVYMRNLIIYSNSNNNNNNTIFYTNKLARKRKRQKFSFREIVENFFGNCHTL
jgi:hypothetical protein